MQSRKSTQCVRDCSFERNLKSPVNFSFILFRRAHVKHSASTSWISTTDLPEGFFHSIPMLCAVLGEDAVRGRRERKMSERESYAVNEKISNWISSHFLCYAVKEERNRQRSFLSSLSFSQDTVKKTSPFAALMILDSLQNAQDWIGTNQCG